MDDEKWYVVHDVPRELVLVDLRDEPTHYIDGVEHGEYGVRYDIWEVLSPKFAQRIEIQTRSMTSLASNYLAYNEVDIARMNRNTRALAWAYRTMAAICKDKTHA